MAGRLSDRYQKRLDAAVKRGKSSFRVTRNGKKSSAINQSTIDAIRGDEEGVLIILENNTEIIEANIGNAVIMALEEIGIEAEKRAKALTPVDTGRLRNSVTHAIDPGDNSVEVGTNVEYARRIEFGMSGTKYKGANEGRGFLRPAINDNLNVYRDILRKKLRGS